SLVLDFYNERRKQAQQVEPNAGHLALSELEQEFKVSIITQNVDNLHERAGSSNVIHLHGELAKVRSENAPSLIYNIGGQTIEVGDTAEEGGQPRPHVVWFGEPGPQMKKGTAIVPNADIISGIGTSPAGDPAAGLTYWAPKAIPEYVIDPVKPQQMD